MDAYALFLKWINAKYDINDDRKILLEGAYFSGPVLEHAEQIRPNDYIDLDFTEQYVVTIPDYYIARLSWKDVKYVGNIVYLVEAMLDCKYKDSLPKLKSDDFVLIDTRLHEAQTHRFFLTYPAVLYSGFGEPYKF